MHLFRLIPLLFLFAATVRAQPLDVTFRYVEEGSFVRAFLPGEFNNWGPNSNGRISVGAVSSMAKVDSLNQWIYAIPLTVGTTYQYKIHLHLNGDGSSNSWISDPLNDRTNPQDNNNSVVTITDPMVFQPARELNDDGLIAAVSAGLFSTSGFAEIVFEVNGVSYDGLPFYNPANGVLRYVLDRPIRSGAQFKIAAIDSSGREFDLEVGEIQPPVSWVTPDYETYVDDASVRGSITRQDGTIDPDLTGARLQINGAESAVMVSDGIMRADLVLQRGENVVVLEAEVDGTTFTSDSLLITRLAHPLADSLVTAEVSGSGSDFSIGLSPVPTRTFNDFAEVIWTFDSTASTVGLDGSLVYNLDQSAVFGTASGPGELYFDVEVTALDGSEDFLSVGIVVEEDGTVRTLRYEETAAWINRAVVYEIFPLSFGPTEASGTLASPGRRLDEIRAELDYIAEMGFNTLWFMPIFHNQIMDQTSGGYNIIDFYNVDPKLGTNEDLRDLVERAHELGLKVVLDITPNHVSPIHPWVESVRDLGEDSPYFDLLQTTPSSHNRGLDNRGPNLAEIWHSEGGRNLYRKYDGFGDLANLDWDDDDLQAHLLDVFAYWVREYDVDGWRMDVYWGPWRRYGPERFGRPLRDLMRRIKPDAWMLGEIEGTGAGTEVYYADDDRGTRVVGGMDAGYDWSFFFNGIRGTYGTVSTYDFYARNNDFWPGPNARYFRFLENHDETRIAKTLRTNPDRILPLTGMLLTTTGIPMIYQGQEVNFGDVGGDERRRPVSWQTERNGEFAEVHQRLAHARTSFPAFWTQELLTLMKVNNVYAYVRPYVDENAVVAINFAGDPRTISIDPTPHLLTTTDGPVSYTHLLADSSFTDHELDGFTLTLAPYETAIFITGTDVEFTVPDLPSLPFGAVYTGEEDAPELPKRAALHQNYPNPFNPTTILPYSLPETAHVRLEVFDMLGRRVAVLVDGGKPAGAHQAIFEAADLSTGLYLVKLDVSGRIFNRTMILAR
ncbi:MAG TPA: alpha-amylase family glycosyl hydrolase [Rhodothermales bacterium]|nr:alpha-amylase family glycosyl hydrolase [Rhodothermales bacterium]